MQLSISDFKGFYLNTSLAEFSKANKVIKLHVWHEVFDYDKRIYYELIVNDKRKLYTQDLQDCIDEWNKIIESWKL